ncbi:MAG: Ni/Fe hydrogenase subunit alpha [Planctomycetes bacterium]|nr:Ni/Fe hydrogenase subunit alpha [Planctomycetota bacterium]
MKDRTIKVDYIARVEGEGALTIRVKDGVCEIAEFRIFEPPRFFEAFLRGRSMMEVPDITARICGICPVAYQMSSCHAIENALGMKIEGENRELRRLLYCGEWIESHVLHVFMLQAPDMFRVPDAVALAKLNPDLVKTALRMKKAGNAIMSLLGGREIHPINVRVGGFYKILPRKDFEALVPELEFVRDEAAKAATFFAKKDFRDYSRDYEFVALCHPAEYPLNDGRIVSSSGLDIACAEYEDNFVEEHVRHSNALHSHIKNRGAYFVGPIARFNLNFEKLSPLALQTAKAIGLAPPVANPYKGILVRLIEVIFAAEESIRIIRGNSFGGPPFIHTPATTGASMRKGTACTEAPRGILFHRYEIDSSESIVSAKIVPPTSQNQPTIENDLRDIAQTIVELSDDEARFLAEQTIRNYDPCISCATHFLRLKIERT